MLSSLSSTIRIRFAAVRVGSLASIGRFCGLPAQAERYGMISRVPKVAVEFMVSLNEFSRLGILGSIAAAGLAIGAALLLPLSPSLAQDTASEEAANRQRALAQLPADAAKRLFGLANTPVPGPARVIGSYTKSCLAGAQQLPADGPNWQVMRPSRNRAWGDPVLISFLERLAATLPAAAGWPGLLVG